MNTIHTMHTLALLTATDVIAGLAAPDWERPSECAGWSVRDLVQHMVGQNFGFAAAIGEGNAPLDEYEPRAVEEWIGSIEVLSRAVKAPAQAIRLAEVRRNETFPPVSVVAMHLLDTVVHTWDICGPPWRPDPEVVDVILEQARHIPDSARRDDGPFAAVMHGKDQDPWHQALRLLGRDPCEPSQGVNHTNETVRLT